MKSLKFGFACLALGNLFLLGGLACPALADDDSSANAQAQAQAQDPFQNALGNVEGTAMTPAAPSELDLEAPPVFVGSCSAQACGNTGLIHGYGSSCSAAQADLASKLNDAGYEICPGVVIAVDINYGTCTGGAPVAGCKFSGNADITCKICAGQSCESGGPA